MFAKGLIEWTPILEVRRASESPWPAPGSSPALWARIEEANVDPTLDDHGDFLVLDARDGSVVHAIPPAKKRLRLNRGRFRKLLMEGLDVRFGKRLLGFCDEADTSFVRLDFADGTTERADLLVAADGNHSVVRRQLLGPLAATHRLPIRMNGVIQTRSAQDLAAARALNPLLWQAINPDTGFYLWHSIQDVHLVERKPESYEVLTIVSHAIDPEQDSRMTLSPSERLADLARRALGSAEPFLALVRGIPPESPVTSFVLEDWIPFEYQPTRTILIGDAAGSMTMFRGEGANHGILDAGFLADALYSWTRSARDLKEVLGEIEREIRQRRQIAVPLSRQAAIDAHRGMPDKESPLIEARVLPEGASRSLFQSMK